MNRRFLAIALTCATTLPSMLSFAAEPPMVVAEWQGTVTMCSGDAVVHRDGNVRRIVRGAGLKLGDQIESADNARLAMSLDHGPVITLGPSAKLTILRDAEKWNLVLPTGEARLVHDGQSALELVSGEAKLSVDRAIIQMDASTSQTRLKVVAGTASCATNATSVRRLAAGAAVVIDVNGNLVPAEKADWKLQDNEIRLATALQATPLLQQPTLTPSVPSADSVPGAGMNSVNQVPPSSPTVQNPDGLLDEDEEERRRRREDEAARTRSNNSEDEFPGDSTVKSTIGSFTGSSSLGLGSLSSGVGAFYSGSGSSDANQQTFQGKIVNSASPFVNGDPFPGAIHLVTAETRYPFQQIQLNQMERDTLFANSPNRYFSISQDAPDGQVITSFQTGTGLQPHAVAIPKVGGYLIELDEFGAPETGDGVAANNSGFAGLVGEAPTSPVVLGATPIEDRGQPINPNATFALGEFLVTRTGEGGDSNSSDFLTFTIRRSDQDRRIVKDVGGDDSQDMVTPNPDVKFTETVDSRFLPQSPTVKAPANSTPGMPAIGGASTKFRDLDPQRRGAFTVLMADQLQGYARRTGQTRFVVDGKIVDISGFKPAQ